MICGRHGWLDFDCMKMKIAIKEEGVQLLCNEASLPLFCFAIAHLTLKFTLISQKRSTQLHVLYLSTHHVMYACARRSLPLHPQRHVRMREALLCIYVYLVIIMLCTLWLHKTCKGCQYRTIPGHSASETYNFHR